MPRKDIEFKTFDHVTLRGWFFTPEASKPDGQLPCLIMAHGWGCVKEMELDRFAESFTKSLAVACLVYDHRGFGASDQREGQPRREFVPHEQISDYSDAVTHARTLQEVDPERVGIWGYSMAGGHVLVCAAGDPRVKAVVSVYPIVSGWNNVHRLIRSDFIEMAYKAFEADRQARATGQEPSRVPIVDANPLAPCSLPAAGAYAWFSSWEGKSNWVNDMTIRSSYLLMSYEPAGHIQYISPRPLMMVVADKDAEAPVDVALHAFAKANEPKHLQILPGGHFDVFGGTNFDKTVKAQVEFLRTNLCA